MSVWYCKKPASNFWSLSVLKVVARYGNHCSAILKPKTSQSALNCSVCIEPGPSGLVGVISYFTVWPGIEITVLTGALV